MRRKGNSKRRGFSVAKLVAVIALTAVLASAAFPPLSCAASGADLASGESFRGPAAEPSEEPTGESAEELTAEPTDEPSEEPSETPTDEPSEEPTDARAWGEIEEPTESFVDYQIGGAPYGLILSYYDDIYSRGFSWITDRGVTDSELYIVPGDGGESADFSSAEAITGTYDDSNAAYASHKVWVTGLSPATVYSYKAGSPSGWEYGVFRTESASPAAITAIQLSDAQTKDPTKLAVWENTMAQAVETAGPELDMILYNGDQYDSNMLGIGADIDRGIRNAVARETVGEYVGSVPYMASTGNHEATPPSAGVYVNGFTVDYGTEGDGGYSGINTAPNQYGGYYSFDYAFAHFAVLNANSILYGDPDQTAWLKDDLAKADGDPAIRWIIVVIHIGLYATGDHSNGVGSLITTLAPIFSECHVDLVMQAHDHTYSKTLPYKWDTIGYTTEYNDSDIVDFSVTTAECGVVYDLDPHGTYYVTTGAAGHRYGASEMGDGIWADLRNDGSSLEDSGLYEAKTFTNNTYKIEVGRITQENSYEPYTYDGVTSEQDYDVGDYASGNVNAPMFGILNLTEDTLIYAFYTADGDTVKLFDTLCVMKTS